MNPILERILNLDSLKGVVTLGTILFIIFVCRNNNNFNPAEVITALLTGWGINGGINLIKK